MMSCSHLREHRHSDVIEAPLMTDIANDIKLRNDLVMRIIKLICIFLLNLNTQIKPCSRGDRKRCLRMVTGHLP